MTPEPGNSDVHPAPASGVGKARRAAAAAALVARHPRTAYRALYAAAHPPNLQAGPAGEAEASAADRFDAAMGMLVGLDVDLTFERDGVVWTVPPGQDGIAEDLFRTGAYSGETIAAILAFVAQERTERSHIVDIGANIGTTTVPFARAGFHVVAIEPVPAALHYLRTNIRANGLDEQVDILDVAIATGMDEVTLAVSTSLGNSEVISGTSEPGFSGHFGRGADIHVPARRLDDALGSCDVDAASLAIVWSDTQGSEPAVIETGASLWAAGVPLFAEFWLPGLKTKDGVRAFIELASAHFRTFIDGSSHGYRIMEALQSNADLQRVARPVADLSGFADEVSTYPDQFTDVLLLP